MWPQLLRCGNSSIIPTSGLLSVRFNVAATFALRKFDGYDRSIAQGDMLQCGRNFCVAEISLNVTTNN